MEQTDTLATVAEAPCALPLDDKLGDELLAMLEPISEEALGATFDELAEIAAAQPEEVLAQRALLYMVATEIERGNAEAAFQMAMTIGAMACLHSHLEDLANEVSVALDGKAYEHPQDETLTQSDSHHDPKVCKDCKAGKRCRRK